MGAETLSRAERFFEGVRVEYEAVRDRGLSVKIVMEGAKVDSGQHAVDYKYGGGIYVEHGNRNLETGVSVHHNSYTFSSRGHLGTLFDDATRKARSLNSAMLATGNPFVPSVDALTRCLFEIINQAEAEFLQKQQHNDSLIRQDLWDKYFKSHMPKQTDE